MLRACDFDTKSMYTRLSVFVVAHAFYQQHVKLAILQVLYCFVLLCDEVQDGHVVVARPAIFSA